MPLEVKDLTISLASGELVAENISFQIEKGEMLSIVGSSGAGKTTICKAIMGLLGSAYQATGQIVFQGMNLLDLTKKERRQVYGKEICFIMQNPMTAFNPSIRVGKQLEKTYRLHHDRFFMNHGKVIEAGITREIIKAPKEEYTAYLLGACRLERREGD